MNDEQKPCVFDRLSLKSKEQSRLDDLADLPHVVFKFWVIQKLGNDS